MGNGPMKVIGFYTDVPIRNHRMCIMANKESKELVKREAGGWPMPALWDMEKWVEDVFRRPFSFIGLPHMRFPETEGMTHSWIFWHRTWGRRIDVQGMLWTILINMVKVGLFLINSNSNYTQQPHDRSDCEEVKMKILRCFDYCCVPR